MDATDPSEDELKSLLEHYQAGNFADAEPLALSLTQQFPKHPFGWKVMGVLLKQTGRLSESLMPLQKAIELSPTDAEAHNNFGNALKGLQRLDEAEVQYNRAIALKPDYAQAYFNLGNTLQTKGNPGSAILCYARAISLNRDYIRAYTNLGMALKKLKFTKRNPSLYPILVDLLTRGNYVRPSEVAGAIVSLIKQENQIKDLIVNTSIFSDIKEVDRAIKVLAQFPLLQQLMRICPVPDLQLEALFVSIRRALLEGLGHIDNTPEQISFSTTLALHCFVNEFVYFETDEEAELIRVTEQRIAETVARGWQPKIAEVLCLAAYRPLHQYEWIEKSQILHQLPAVRERLVEEPRAEKVIAKQVRSLATVGDAVSRKVREQYEENPYPRWVKLMVHPKPQSLATFCEEAKLRLQSENIKSVSAPSILIAGCGTGQHSIGVASRFTNCHVTAVDLSCASLAYAQRKTRELGITNVEYLHADILELGELEQKFDLIECAGVLHHMNDPMAGWRVLVNLLRAGGLMKIGLYSELARRHIKQSRREIFVDGIGASAVEIRQFRRSVVESHYEHHKQLTSHFDFFSLSMLRDLTFHSQEHRFRLSQIQSYLDNLGLMFCGFESRDTVDKFKAVVGEEADTCDLSLWDKFEESHPSTFASMYQFWCQKSQQVS